MRGQLLTTYDRRYREYPPSPPPPGHKRFEIVAPVRFGLVCFRLKASDAANEELRQVFGGLGYVFVPSGARAYYSGESSSLTLTYYYRVVFYLVESKRRASPWRVRRPPLVWLYQSRAREFSVSIGAH